ncbi:MAG: nucleotidyl transferase AbiEii/AbiGii toxin family protein [Planctomycetes bacterium]|nr:nucleotidyl transferase AbiEii/AbiGii toxin family protein [Planctomycetota bacterium]
MKLQSADLALLRDLLAVVPHPAQPCFLVGAGARVLGLDERFGIAGARATLDWDFAVRVGSWREWESLRARLLDAPGRPFRPTSAQHRLEHAQGRQLDLVPFGGLETGAGEIVWPDATRMTVHGFAEAAAHCDVIEVENGLLVHVASLPSLALLKLHAYLDRRTKGVTKDIQDFDWIARHYDFPSDHELRIHEELAERLIASGTEFSEAGAMLLGVDVARIHSMAVIAPVRRLLTESLDPHSRAIEDVLKAARGLDDERRQELRGRIAARMQAFERGLDDGRAS